MRISPQFPLLLLPDELIALVIEHVDDVKSLRSLTRTCHRLQDIAEGKLYRTLLLRSGTSTRGLKRSLRSRPERAKAIRKLECPLKSTESQKYELLEQIFTAATGAREIMFESPACNTADFEDFDEWEYMAHHLFRPFQEAAIMIGKDVRAKPLQQLQEGECPEKP